MTVKASGEGLRLVLSAIKHPKNITVDDKGRPLLQTPFTFQCGAMEEFPITRNFTQTSYDTIVGKSYSRRGSNQLKTWQFDTLAMEMRVMDSSGRLSPGWVPFPEVSGAGASLQPQPADWYAQQMEAISDSGAPFKFVAHYVGQTRPILNCMATLLEYNESYEAGEIDAVYFKGVQFQEWRDPEVKEAGLGRNQGKLPTTVTLYTHKSGSHAAGACYHDGKRIPKSGDCTLIELARWFYHEPSDWREIAKANNLTKGGGGHTHLVDFPRFKHGKAKSYKLKIPKLKKPKTKTHHHKKAG